MRRIANRRLIELANELAAGSGSVKPAQPAWSAATAQFARPSLSLLAYDIILKKVPYEFIDEVHWNTRKRLIRGQRLCWRGHRPDLYRGKHAVRHGARKRFRAALANFSEALLLEFCPARPADGHPRDCRMRSDCGTAHP